MSTPYVTVVIPTFNRARLVGQAIDSVLGQSFSDLEIIVVDDASTDETQPVLDAYGERIRVIRNRVRRGPGGARNAGIAAARGAYIAFLDSDDLWLSEKLEKQLRALKPHGKARWVYSDAFAYEEASETIAWRFSDLIEQWEGEIARHLVFQDFIPSPTPVVCRAALDEAGGFSEELMYGEDWDLWLRIAVRHPIARIPEPLAIHRIHTGMATADIDPTKELEARLAVLARAGEYAPIVYAQWLPNAKAHQFVLAGRAMMKRGRSREARWHFRRAVDCCPCSLSARLALGSSYLPVTLYRVLRGIYRSIRRPL